MAYRRSRQNQNETPNTTQNAGKPQYDSPSKGEKNPNEILDYRNLKGDAKYNFFNLQRGQNQNETKELQERQQVKPPINETHVKPQSEYPCKSGTKEEKNPTDHLEYRNPFNLQRGQYHNETKELQERQQVKPPINETHVKPQSEYPCKSGTKEEKNPTDHLEYRNPFNLQRGQYHNETKELQERQQVKPPINETHVKPQSEYPCKSGTKEEKNPTDHLEYRNPFNLQRGQYHNETKELQERQQVKPPINETHVKPQSEYPCKSGTKEEKNPTDHLEYRNLFNLQRGQNQNETKELQDRQQGKQPTNETHLKTQSESPCKLGTKEEKNPTDRLVYRNPFNLQRGQYHNETKELQERQQVKPPINETHLKTQNDGPSKAISREGQHPTDIMEGRDIKRVVSRNPFQRSTSQNKTNEVQERQQANLPLHATHVKPQTDSPSKSGTKEENQDVNRVLNYNPFQRGQNQNITKEIQERQQANATQAKPQFDGHRRGSKENQQPSDFMEFRHVKGLVHYNPSGLQPGQYRNETKELQAKPPLKATSEKPQSDLPPKGMKEAGEQKKVELPLKGIPEKAQADLPPQSPSKGMKEVVEQKKVEVPRRETLRKSQPNLPPQSTSKEIKEVVEQKKVEVPRRETLRKSQPNLPPQSTSKEIKEVVEQKKAEGPPKTPPRKSQSVSKGTNEVNDQKRPNVSFKATPETNKSALPTQSASKGIKEVVEQKNVEVPHRETLRKSQPNLPPQSASKGMKATLSKSQSDIRQSASKGMKEVVEQKKVEVPHRETLRKSQPNLPPQSASKGMKEVDDQKKSVQPSKATPSKSQSDIRQSTSKGIKEVVEQKNVEVPHRETLRKSQPNLPSQSASKGMKEVDDQKKAEVPPKATPSKSQSDIRQSASKGMKEVNNQKKAEVPPKPTPIKSQSDIRQSASQSVPKGIKEVDAQKKADAPPKATPKKSQLDLPPQSASKGMKEVGEQKRPKLSLKPTLRNSKSDSIPKQKPNPSPPKQKAAASSSQLPSTKLPPQQSPSSNQQSRRQSQPSTPGQVNRNVRLTKQDVSGIGQSPKPKKQLQLASRTLYPRRPLHWPKIDYSQLHQQPTKKRRVLRRVYVGTNNWESVQLQQQLQLESAASQNPYNVCIREHYHQYLSNSYCEGSCHPISPSGPSSTRDAPIPRGKRHSHRSI